MNQTIRKNKITELYRSILGREPDLEGLNHYSNINLSLNEIENILKNSQEAINLSIFNSSTYNTKSLVEMNNNCSEHFKFIYDNDIWGGGSQSKLEWTGSYISYLENIIKKYNVKTVLDYGCGDWEFSKTIDWDNLVDSYIGVDIVESVIQTNKQFESEKIKFKLLDDNWRFESADLIICKDVLQHLPNSFIVNLLEQFKTNSKLTLLTNGLSNTEPDPFNQNENCTIGSFRTLNLSKSPWNLNPTDSFDWNYGKNAVKQTILLIN